MKYIQHLRLGLIILAVALMSYDVWEESNDWDVVSISLLSFVAGAIVQRDYFTKNDPPKGKAIEDHLITK